MTQQQQPEANGSMPVAAAEESSNPPRRRPLVLRDVMFQACIQNKSFLTTRGEIQDVLHRAGDNAADLADLLSGEIGQRFTTDGTLVSAPNANGGDRGDLVLLDDMANAALVRNDQYNMLVQHIASSVAPSGGNRDRDRLAALLGSASAGDDAAAPLGKRVFQFLGGVANDLWSALDRDIVAPMTVRAQDALCSSSLAAQCIKVMLERAPRDGSAVLLHRSGDEEKASCNTFEGFCRETTGLGASELLREVESSSLDLLLDVMVRSGLATLHDNGKIVAIGGPVDEIRIREFKR